MRPIRCAVNRPSLVGGFQWFANLLPGSLKVKSANRLRPLFMLPMPCDAGGAVGTADVTVRAFSGRRDRAVLGLCGGRRLGCNCRVLFVGGETERFCPQPRCNLGRIWVAPKVVPVFPAPRTPRHHSAPARNAYIPMANVGVTSQNGAICALSAVTCDPFCNRHLRSSCRIIPCEPRFSPSGRATVSFSSRDCYSSDGDNSHTSTRPGELSLRL